MSLTIQQCLDILGLDKNYTCGQVDKVIKPLIKAHPERRREFQTAAIRLKTNIDRSVAQNLLGLNNDFELDMIEKAFQESPKTEMHIRAHAFFHVELANMERGIASKLGLPEFTTDVNLITKVFNDRREIMMLDPDAMRMFARYQKAMINRANYLLSKKEVVQEAKAIDKRTENQVVQSIEKSEEIIAKPKDKRNRNKDVKEIVEIINVFILENITLKLENKVSAKEIYQLFSKLNSEKDSRILRSFKILFKKQLKIKFPETIVNLKDGRIVFKNIGIICNEN